MRSRRGLSPALVLFLLSPAIGELLSGSSPPAEFSNPFGLMLLASLYGSGAILCRELTWRWKKGWPTLLALGAAYGIVEEGLMVKSFFDPSWMDLGPLGVYGRWAGVNWVWAVVLTAYHALFSISIPVLLVSLTFPARRGEAWLGRRSFRLLTGLLVFVVAFGFFALTPYRPPWIPYLMAAACVFALYGLARKLPTPTRRVLESAHRLPGPVWFCVVGFAGTLVFFLMAWVVPNTQVPPTVNIALIGGWLWWLGSRLARRLITRDGKEEARLHALAAGALGFFILLAPLQEFDPTRVDNTSGMTLVGLVALLALVLLYRQLRRRSAWEAMPPEMGASPPAAVG
ncbi:MAG: hypothetical protein AB1449_09170 [Chloroflexota bacterium]